MAHAHRRAAAGGAAALAVLLLAAPPPRAAVSSLTTAGPSADPTGPLVGAVALLAWTVTGWLALTVVVVLLSRVPGLLGRTARRLAGRIAPATLRRTLEAVLGLTVAVSGLAPTAALAAPTAGPSPAAVLGAERAWDLDWPSRATSVSPAPAAPAPAPATSRPPTPPASSVRPPPVRAAAAPPPALRPPAAAPRAAARPSPAVPATGAVVVQAGDSLWSVAKASLRSTGTAAPTHRQVAQAWPRWWAANRDVVGDDPDLLLPGTVLRPPGDPH